jgi:DNA adenine methylase
MTTSTTGDLRRNGFSKDKKICFDYIDKTNKYLYEANARFWNEDFKLFINRIMLRGSERPLQDMDTFIYCDPPYLETANNYISGFTEKDSFDLFECLVDKDVNFAISEFNHPFILEQAKQRNLNIIVIGERQNLKNRRTEILITNYEKTPTLFS